jgi:uncharacterized membrane protein YdjX (TVP38/TMEM64 family)
VVLLLVLGGLFGVGVATGLTDKFTVDGIREMMADAGVWGVLLLWALFAVGQLVQVPGMLFVTAASLAYGPFYGGLVGWGGAMTSIMTSFFVVRGVGGQLLAEVHKPWMKRALDKLDERPYTAVFVLRLVLMSSPILNYALALSTVRLRPYFFGSLFGVAPAVFITALIAHGVFG